MNTDKSLVCGRRRLKLWGDGCVRWVCVPKRFTFRVNVVNADDAIVVINGVERSEFEAVEGTVVNWSVSKDGYKDESGRVSLNGDMTIDVDLEREMGYTFYLEGVPEDSTLIINGEERGAYRFTIGETIQYSVSHEGYLTMDGTKTMTEDMLNEQGNYIMVCYLFPNS